MTATSPVQLEGKASASGFAETADLDALRAEQARHEAELKYVADVQGEHADDIDAGVEHGKELAETEGMAASSMSSGETPGFRAEAGSGDASQQSDGTSEGLPAFAFRSSVEACFPDEEGSLIFRRP